jgi:DNA adenine methylase
MKLPKPCKRIRSPIPWFGGKGKMTAKLLPLLPTHRIYVEPFGGGASLLFAKDPASVEVYNDLDQGLVGLFRVLRDPAKFERFWFLTSMTPYARNEWDECRRLWDTETDEVRRAWRWFVVARQSFGGHFGASWGSAVTASSRGMAETASKWLSTLDNLGRVHERLFRVQIECADWRRILDRYDTPETCFYCDPPYVPDTRRAGGYDHELSEADHVELVERLATIQGKAMVSGYPSPIYRPLVRSGWKRKDWRTACHAAGRTRQTGIQGNGSALAKQPRTECVWIKD